jgi:hypothetical protein
VNRLRHPAGAALVALALLTSCERPAEPQLLDGRVVLRFQPAETPGAAAATYAAALFDSVAVRVFHRGSPLHLETAKGVAIVNDDPIDVAVSCAAENGKKVSVELFVGGWMVYHGSDPDVDVAAGKSTAVTIDVAAFYVDSLAVNPTVVSQGAAFNLRWSPSPAAEWYDVEASRTPDFAVIEWEQSLADTTVDALFGTGSHYFRVTPKTTFASGLFAGPKFGYVVGGSQAVTITGFSTPAVIPGETVTILGENLDFPGTEVWMGGSQMVIVSSTWGSIVARVPLRATTDWISATSGLGSDTSPDPLVVQRVAYVNATGEFALSYITLLDAYAADFGYSGVASIPVAELDWRDMGVFDIVIIANDTAGPPWGGNGSRVAAITATTANVLAIGEGGLGFLRRAISSISGIPNDETSQTSVYTDNGSAAVFTTPHDVTGGGNGWVDISKNNQRTLALDLGASGKPAGVGLYACTGLNLLFPNDKWALLDFQVPDTFSANKRYVFWGYAADPADFTSQGADCLGNVMNLLWRDRAVTPTH